MEKIIETNPEDAAKIIYNKLLFELFIYIF